MEKDIDLQEFQPSDFRRSMYDLCDFDGFQLILYSNGTIDMFTSDDSFTTSIEELQKILDRAKAWVELKKVVKIH